MKFKPIKYQELSSRDKEIYNFQTLSGLLADYGYQTFRLSNDWNYADLLAHHLSGETVKIQLKGRLTFSKKYEGKDLHIAFQEKNHWYIYPHDELLDIVISKKKMISSQSWSKDGLYTFPSIPSWLKPCIRSFWVPVKSS